jgi:hypothetical protein
MRCSIMAKVTLGVFFAAFLIASPAYATLFCDVKKTKDGFVAVREKPDARSKILVKVPFGEDVQLDSTRNEAKGWAPVIYSGPRRGKMIPGWVRSSLIVQECG